MQEGNFRCDANVSVRRPGEPLGTRCEIKNLNSFRFLAQAIEYEARRQIELLEDGGAVVQETRLFDPDRNRDAADAQKEDAQDYRYFPDPDLPPLDVDDAWIERIRAAMPELPAAMRERFVAQHGISAYDAAQLTASRELVDYYDAVCRALPAQDAAARKLVANWVLGEFSAARNRSDIAIAAAPVAARNLPGCCGALPTTRYPARWRRRFSTRCGQARPAPTTSRTRSSNGAGCARFPMPAPIETLVDAGPRGQSRDVAEFRAGREKAFNALVGQVMKASKGKANPAQVNEILRRKLG